MVMTKSKAILAEELSAARRTRAQILTAQATMDITVTILSLLMMIQAAQASTTSTMETTILMRLWMMFL